MLCASINHIIVTVFTQEDTASAWGVNLVEPIVIFVRFKCMSLYLDGVGMCYNLVIFNS